MNAYTLIATLSLAFAAATPVMAQEFLPETPVPATSQVARAEVQAGARSAVLSNTQQDGYEAHVARASLTTTPVLSRAAVKAETRAAVKSGEIDRLRAASWALDVPATRAKSNALRVSQAAQ